MQRAYTKLECIVLAISLSLPIAAIAQTKVDPSSTLQRDSQSPASPANAGPKAAPTSLTLGAADRKFARDAAMGGMMAVEMGKVVLQRSSTDQGRQMAQHIIEDHTQANAQLQSLAQSKGIDIPTQLDSEHQKEIAKLQKVSDKDFDRKYFALMVSEHKKDIKAFRHEAARGSDSDLKQLARTTLPKLEQHMKAAQNSQKAVAGGWRPLLPYHAEASNR